MKTYDEAFLRLSTATSLLAATKRDLKHVRSLPTSSLCRIDLWNPQIRIRWPARVCHSDTYLDDVLSHNRWPIRKDRSPELLSPVENSNRRNILFHIQHPRGVRPAQACGSSITWRESPLASAHRPRHTIHLPLHSGDTFGNSWIILHRSEQDGKKNCHTLRIDTIGATRASNAAGQHRRKPHTSDYPLDSSPSILPPLYRTLLPD